MLIRGEEGKNQNRIVEYNLQPHSHNGSGFDTWIIIKILPCDKHIVDIIKNSKGMIFWSLFNGYLHTNKKQIAQYLIFRCGMTH